MNFRKKTGMQWTTWLYLHVLVACWFPQYTIFLYTSGIEDEITISIIYRSNQTVGKGQQGEVNGGSGYDHRRTRASLSVNPKTR